MRKVESKNYIVVYQIHAVKRRDILRGDRRIDF